MLAIQLVQRSKVDQQPIVGPSREETRGDASKSLPFGGGFCPPSNTPKIVKVKNQVDRADSLQISPAKARPGLKQK